MIKVILVIIILILFLKKDNIEALCVNRYYCNPNKPSPSSYVDYDLVDIKDNKLIPYANINNQTNLSILCSPSDKEVLKINNKSPPECNSDSATENCPIGCYNKQNCMEASEELKLICKNNFDENLSDELYINNVSCENNTCEEDDFKIDGVCCKTACKFKSDLYYNLYLNSSPSPPINNLYQSPIKKFTCVTNYDCNCDYTNNFCIDNECVSLKPKLEIVKLKWIIILVIIILLFFAINPVLIVGFIACIIFLLVAFYFGIIIYTNWIICSIFLIFFIYYIYI
jgi:hypothetical protein